MVRIGVIGLVLAAMVLVIGCRDGASAGAGAGAGAGAAKDGAGNPLAWKCLWVWGMPRKTAADAAEEARVSRTLGFNAIATAGSEAYMKMLVPEAHARGLEVYAVHTGPQGEWGFMKLGSITAPAGCLQEYPAEEMQKLEHSDDPDILPLPGPFLCIDRPEVRQYAADLAVALMASGVDGVALDWVGYKNHSGCQCAYSRAQRAKFIAAHPEMSPEVADTAFSIEQMTAYYQSVRDAVKARYPKAKLMCHLYPQFHPYEPAIELHGNRYPVEYPVQTVAWYFKPHWSLEKVAQRCRIVKETEHKTHPYVTATGFIGLATDPTSIKTPQRLSDELQVIKAAGLKGFCVAGDVGILKDAPLMAAMARELGGEPTILKPATQPAK